MPNFGLVQFLWRAARLRGLLAMACGAQRARFWDERVADPFGNTVCVFRSTRLLVHMLNVRLFVRWGRHRGQGTHLRRVRLHRAQVCRLLLLLLLQLASILMQVDGCATLCDISVMSLSGCQRLDGLKVHHQSTSVFFIESGLHVLERFQSLCRVVYVVIVVSSFRCYCSFK